MLTYLTLEGNTFLMPSSLLQCYYSLCYSPFYSYPFRWFQKLLNRLPGRWHILHTFVDSFQGCYKDGTELDTRDCRFFASLFFLGRLLLFLIAAFVGYNMFFIFGTFAIALFTLSIVIVQPFKAKCKHYSNHNAGFLFLVAMFYTCLTGIDISRLWNTELFTLFLTLIVVNILRLLRIYLL